jgi:hypothetical protein
MPTYDYPLSLNTISYEAATNSTPLTMTELYGVKFTDGSNTAPSGTIALSDFRLKNVQPYKYEEQLVPSNVTTGDRYGLSTAFATGYSSWGFYLFVSSAYDDYGSYTNAGSVRLYIKERPPRLTRRELQAGGWALSPYTITPPDPGTADYFGTAIAVDKYADWVAVSAPYWESNTYTDTGAVYFYERASSDHRQYTYRGIQFGPYQQAGGRLGYTPTSLSMDSWATYTVVGGPYFHRYGYGYLGRVYLYTRSGSTWSSSTSNVFYPPSSDFKSYLYYGYSVSAKNPNRFVVGAYGANDSPYTSCGAVYVYAKSGSTWSLEQRLVASDRASTFYFGFGVDISEDGYYIIVGSYYRNHQSYIRVGGAYIFIRSGTTWQQQAILNPPVYANDTYFGQKVHISPDGSYAVVGAEREQSSTGSVCVFSRSGTTWSLRSKVTASDASPNYFFGNSIAISEDSTMLMVGSNNHSGGRGSVYTYQIEDLPVVQTSVTSSVSMTGGIFTYDPPVSITYNGERVAYGSYTASIIANTPNSGVVGIFKKNQGSFTLDTTITASDAGTNDQFGTSVSITDDVLLVGAPLWDDTSNNFSNSGAAYLFTLSGGVWTETTKFLPSDPSTSGGGFGASVAIHENSTNIYVVSRPGWDDTSNNFTNAGAVYLFTTYVGQSSPIDKLISPNAASNENFGSRIDISQTFRASDAHIVVSALGSEKVYIFRPGTGGAYNSGWYCIRTITEPTSAWTGSSTIGRNFGWDLSISGDGQHLAILRRGQSHPEVGVVFTFKNYVYDRSITPLNDYESNIRDINSVSLSYSGTRLLIGDSDRGRAYLYTRDFSDVLSEWTHRLRYLLKNPHARNSQYGDIDNFGFRVKMSGDGKHALITENYEPFLFSAEEY